MSEHDAGHVRVSLSREERDAVARAGYRATAFTDQMVEAVEQIIADRFAAIEWYRGKVPGYLAESYEAAIKHDDCPGSPSDAAWARDHYRVVRSHGCDDPAPECACGSPLTPHRRPRSSPEQPCCPGHGSMAHVRGCVSHPEAGR